eukprot:2779574-Rhodomonas_salina.1
MSGTALSLSLRLSYAMSSTVLSLSLRLPYVMSGTVLPLYAAPGTPRRQKDLMLVLFWAGV